MSRVDVPVNHEILAHGKRGRLYPGQGTQEVGMGQALYQAYPEARRIFHRVEAATGIPISRICFDGPQEELFRTDRTQLGIFTTSLATEAVLISEDLIPQANRFAGHSLGEYSALVSAGSMDVETAAQVLKARSEGMQRACELNPGGMIATPTLDVETIDKLQEMGMEVALINTDDQIVFGGSNQSIEKAMLYLLSLPKKVKAIRLPTAGAFHTSLMSPAQEILGDALAKASIQAPKHTVVANTSGEILHTAQAVINELTDQVIKTVNWVKGVRTMDELGVEESVELNHKGTLSKMQKKLLEGGVATAIVIAGIGEVAYHWKKHHDQ